VSAAQSWDQESREFALTCDADGKVRWTDARATKLNLRPGDSFHALAVPGTEEKFASFFKRARQQAYANVEIPLLIGSDIVTCSFHAKPDGEGGVMLLGSWLPDDYGRTLRQIAESIDEMQNLNRQIIRQKHEIEEQKKSLERTLAELADSNKGITALHLELEDKAEVLQRTAEFRGRMVANVSHEFRTPLHTILGLSRLLMEDSDGPLSAEQRKQMQFIRSSAEELTGLVDDLLDLASAEAGKMVMRLEKFNVSDFVSGLRGTLRPLLRTPERVKLTFVEPDAALELETDQSKLSQILRNLVSTALKFTEAGEVEVSVGTRLDDVVFKVRDTGLGIAPEHFERIFEEFGQIENPLQARVKGTGLGLPLSRRLAESLGGVLTVESEVGKGSTFTLRIPRVHAEAKEMSEIETRPVDRDQLLRKLRSLSSKRTL
jgi:signal transduction histidine kinase